MGNPWMEHLAKVWKKNKGKKSYKETMKEAKASYKKGKASKSKSSHSK